MKNANNKSASSGGSDHDVDDEIDPVGSAERQSLNSFFNRDGDKTM